MKPANAFLAAPLLTLALLAPALCYVWIAVYGFICRRPPVQA